MDTIRLALFLCDTPISTVLDTSGDYTAIFNTFLRNSLPASSSTVFVLDPYDVRNKQEYPEDISKYHGIILTGSAASAYENLDWINRLLAYIASVAEEKPDVKLLGICFGHQIIARALGCECVPNGGNWEVGITPINLSPIGKRIFGTDILNIQQMHRDHVPAVPQSCHLLGSTGLTPNQGFVRFAPHSDITRPSEALNDIQIFTVQGHPEFTTDIVNKIVDARLASSVLDEETAEDGRRRAAWRNDGVSVIGRVLWRILGVSGDQ